MLVTETFHGYIETTQDVLLIFEGCRRGLLPRICRRLQERERKMIRSGSIFVFDERESGIKRWTDGRVWSPSRILGNFLIYRELDKKATNNEKKMSISSANNLLMMNNNNNNNDNNRRSFSIDSSVSIDRNKERQLVGSLSDSYRFKEDGLIKKTMSIIVNGVAQHLISYYDPNEVIQEKLRAPSSVPELASLEISPELLVKQNFRIPPLVEPTFDQQQGQLTPPEHQQHQQQQQQQQQQQNRLMHPLRSMSVGSIRGHQDMIQQMYHHSTPYNNNNNNNTNNNNNNIPNNVYNSTHQQNNNFPSPSSLSSSPSTPMLSPARQSYQQQQQHQRHYSASSISTNSLPRFDPRNYSEPFNTSNNTTNNNNERHLDNERFAQPNLGQLLNPIHPLNNTSNNSNDILHSMGISSHQQQPQQQQQQHHHHPYDYSNNNNNNIRNSISSQHEDNTPTPTTSTNNNNNNNTGDNSNNNTNQTTSTGGGGGGGGVPEYMHFYQRQPLATHHVMNNNNNVMYQNDEHIAFMNGGLGPDQNCLNDTDIEHLMLK